jgi:hypothetical protein
LNHLPLFLQALPLSVQTFWRYLLLLPFLAIGAFVLFLTTFVPIIGLFVPGTISTGLVIIGLRCALSARGHGNELDAVRLLTVSVAFCLINIFVDLLVMAGNWIVAWGIDLAGIEIDPVGLLVGLLGLSYYWAGVLLVLLSPTALASAALAVPMTAAAISATPRGGGTKLFYGLGAGFPGLMIVMAVWLFGGHVFSIFGEVWTTFGLMASALWAWYQGDGLPWDISLDPWSAFASTLYMTWASSWFFATAVLTWERKVEFGRAERAARIEANRVSSDDIRDLRTRRMRGISGSQSNNHQAPDRPN